MPETRKYLLQNMSAFELIGYNKVADNTFVNIVPMTHMVASISRRIYNK
jgi:hypothetical protein